jgi:spore coat protein A
LKWTEADVGVEKTVTVPAGNVNVWVTENPALMDIEIWDIYNFTVDGHPIHLHLVRFEVESRRLIGAPAPAVGVGRQPSETGFKDTVIALPGEITRIKAKFDIAGLYVWHCHIVEHEDNEMMRPYFVGP